MVMGDAMKAITRDQANATYDIIVRLAGADEDERQSFVRTLLEDRSEIVEYRFRGWLGTGGKLKINGNRPVPYVDCYHEHLNPERQSVIERTNDALEKYYLRGSL